VEVTERSALDGRRLIFLMNASAEPQRVTLDAPMEDVWSGERVAGTAELGPHGVRVLRA